MSLKRVPNQTLIARVNWLKDHKLISISKIASKYGCSSTTLYSFLRSKTNSSTARNTFIKVLSELKISYTSISAIKPDFYSSGPSISTLQKRISFLFSNNLATPHDIIQNTSVSKSGLQKFLQYRSSDFNNKLDSSTWIRILYWAETIAPFRYSNSQSTRIFH